MNPMDKITVSSFNCRGLRDQKKRLAVFNWLKSKYKGLVFLQETHSMIEDKMIWEKEWGSNIYFGHGNTQSRGVAILIPGSLSSKFFGK